eukprot:COSAG01_NODE_3761_length_5722_cov_2.962298_9_plen_115_part_00
MDPYGLGWGGGGYHQVGQVFKKWIMPLTKDVEVEYHLRVGSTPAGIILGLAEISLRVLRAGVLDENPDWNILGLVEISLRVLRAGVLDDGAEQVPAGQAGRHADTGGGGGGGGG